MVSGGGAIGFVGLAGAAAWMLLVGRAVPTPLIGAAQPPKKKMRKMNEQILFMDALFTDYGWLVTPR